MNRFLWPLVAFIVLVGFLAVGLGLNPREVPSPLVGKPAPAFSAPVLGKPGEHISPAAFKGRVWLFNVWASWCAACREEHPLLMELARSQVVPVIGLNYKDKSPDAQAWLQKLGNPYVASAEDGDGRISIDYGVYGVPETFVIDKEGVIRAKHIGPVTPDVLEKTLLPLIRKLQQ